MCLFHQILDTLRFNTIAWYLMIVFCRYGITKVKFIMSENDGEAFPTDLHLLRCFIRIILKRIDRSLSADYCNIQISIISKFGLIDFLIRVNETHLSWKIKPFIDNAWY